MFDLLEVWIPNGTIVSKLLGGIFSHMPRGDSGSTSWESEGSFVSDAFDLPEVFGVFLSLLGPTYTIRDVDLGELDRHLNDLVRHGTRESQRAQVESGCLAHDGPFGSKVWQGDLAG